MNMQYPNSVSQSTNLLELELQVFQAATSQFMNHLTSLIPILQLRDPTKVLGSRSWPTGEGACLPLLRSHGTQFRSYSRSRNSQDSSASEVHQRSYAFHQCYLVTGIGDLVALCNRRWSSCIHTRSAAEVTCVP